MFAGDGTLRGYFRTLRAALGEKQYDVIHAHSPHTGVLLLLGLIWWRSYRRLQPKTVYTVHDSFQNYKLRNKLLLVPVLVLFRRVVFCSHASYQSFPRAL